MSDADGVPGTEFRLRRATNADSEAIIALHECALREAGTDPTDVPGTDDLHDVEGSYHDAGGVFYVVEAPDGAVVAMGGARPVEAGTVELFRVAVAPERQREGHGARILDALESFAREADHERVVLETAARQASATEFYPARGYRETGRRHHGEYELVAFEKRL